MNMAKIVNIIGALLIVLLMIGCDDSKAGQKTKIAPQSSAAHESETGEVPVKGVVTMLDLGADKCIPCKMMAPILVELKKEYQGKAEILFLDVWKDNAPAQRFGIKAIPTQIFFDNKGQEVFRHVGFFSKEEIISQLKSMGVK